MKAMLILLWITLANAVPEPVSQIALSGCIWGPCSDGDESGLFYASIDIGYPAQTFNVQLDTGSSDLALPVSSCGLIDSTGNCPNDGSFDENAPWVSYCSSGGYDISASSSGQYDYDFDHEYRCSGYDSDERCIIQDCYGDNTGFNSSPLKDTVTFGGLSVTATFAGIFQEYGPFETSPVDGILGLAYKSISFGESPVFTALETAGYTSNIYTFCLASYYNEGGIFFLGGLDDYYYTGEIAWVPITHDEFYQADATRMVVGNDAWDISSVQVIVDSGTTLIYIPQFFQDAIETELSTNSYGTDDNGCYIVDEGYYPTFQIMMNTVAPGTAVLPILDYLYAYYEDGYDHLCQIMTAVGPDDQIILGDVFMQAYTVVFDRQANTLGFAQTLNCGGSDWGENYIYLSGSDTTNTPITNYKPGGDGDGDGDGDGEDDDDGDPASTTKIGLLSGIAMLSLLALLH